MSIICSIGNEVGLSKQATYIYAMDRSTFKVD